jgi:hypothetical protein
MPVTIGEVTSTVNVVDSNLPLSPEAMERLVRLVMRRLKEQERWEALTKQESELGNRMTSED